MLLVHLGDWSPEKDFCWGLTEQLHGLNYIEYSVTHFHIIDDSMLLGYRHVHLLGNNGESLGYATLFVHIEIKGGTTIRRSSVAVRSSLFVWFTVVSFEFKLDRLCSDVQG